MRHSVTMSLDYFTPSFLGLFLPLCVPLPFCFEAVDAGREVGFERHVVDDFFESPREIQRFGIEVSLLCLPEEVLDSYVHDI